LQDKDPLPEYRYSDDEVFEAINAAMSEVRAKRPDAFLGLATGLRTPLPVYAAASDMATVFPLDQMFYDPVLYYVVGRCELREDPFSEDSRATTLINKFITQLLSVQS
jgi:hypothetical protein